jgi:hypothetical protein
MGPFKVVEHAPGEILLHWTFPGRDFHGATWLAVRLPSEGVASSGHLQGDGKNSTSGTGPDRRDAEEGNGAGEKGVSGEVEFFFGSAGWEEGAGKPRDVFGGLGGVFHTWYSKLLLWAGVQRLRKQK